MNVYILLVELIDQRRERVTVVLTYPKKLAFFNF